MSRKLFLATIAIVLAAGATMIARNYLDSPVTAEQIKKELDVQKKLDLAQAKENTTPAATTPTPAPTPAPAPAPSAEEWPAKAPDVFKVKLECSMGDFVVECHKDWAPIGVERFYELVKSGFFNDARFFRVVPNFVAQFGIPADPKLAAEWRVKTIKDEPVKQSNVKGTLTFAKSSAPNSRTTQLFINFKDNVQLDDMGFAAFGKVSDGMDIVMKINPEYREAPNQGMIQSMGNEYLKKSFPRLDYIKKISLVK
ncbi:MAG TPA: peptidylprolyl isomerase [Candidatus Hydrogenedentes bacterium]|nr:peptidylprolyl isomerase [Candidatus Hydrogenedentota bacterium]